jgi:predicted GIY-YIG superfamily endonuclease
MGNNNKMEKNIQFIYVLELKNNKFYIGRTNNLERRLLEHTTNPTSEWIKKHKPIKMFESFEMKTQFDEDNLTKTYMKKYGIDNCRGGTYTTYELSSEVKNLLIKEFNHTIDACFNCGSLDHYSKDCKEKKEQKICQICRITINSEKCYEMCYGCFVKKNKIKIKVKKCIVCKKKSTPNKNFDYCEDCYFGKK